MKVLDSGLSSQPDFKTELQSRDPRGTGTAQDIETAFRAATDPADLLVAIAIKRSLLAD